MRLYAVDRSDAANAGLARAESFDAQQKALDLITSTADKICNVVAARDEVNSEEVKGSVNAQLGGFASKLADIGVSGTGSITSEQYQNVLRSDLAATIKDNAACKLKVFDTLQNKLLGSKPRADINVTRDFFAGRGLMQKNVGNISSYGSMVDYLGDGTFTGHEQGFFLGFGTTRELKGRLNLTSLRR